jgi:cysteine-rich repeat protein
MVAASTCYDICPVRYASNASDYQCDACPTYDCYYCGVNGKCTDCSATVDFRVMDSATMRCLPLPGYYDNGVSQAVPCVAANCLTCTTSTKCLSCYTGKYLSGTSCLTCMANCANCTTATTCITCNPYYVFTSGTCVANCSNVTYCATCTVSSGIVCSACSTGYSLVGGICMEVCGDGMLVTPEVCDDNNIISGDGCSSTCQVEVGFFCNTASPTLCQPCSSNCPTCTSAVLCTVCATGYSIISGACVLDCTVITYCATCSYSSILPGTHCDSCQNGYEVQLNSTCASRCGDGKRVPSEGCDDGATVAGDGCSPTCTVETGYFCTDTFPNPSTCALCISDCDVCSDATTCTTCRTGYVYDTTTSPPTCKADCTPISNCLTCSYSVGSGTLCLSCNDGYYPNGANGCDPQCGDGKRVASEGCDDYNNANNDGCSSSCTVESGFYCTDTFPNPSTCSACVSFCITCSNHVSCTACSTDYAYNSTLNACTIDCTVVSQCLTCDYFATITRCLTCNPGYHVDNSTNTCKTQCGDGWRTPDEACDDGNSNNGDGCSSTCVQ